MTEKDQVSKAIQRGLISAKDFDATPTLDANVVDGLFAIARAIENLASATRVLGTADAADPRGAIELLSMEVRDGFRTLANAIEDASE